MRYYVKALKNYANFNGGASRKEYWMFQLFFGMIYVATALLDITFGPFSEDLGVGLLSAMVWLFHILPSLSLTVRRLHDIDKDGWFLLFFLIPIVGPILLLIWMLTPGTPGENRFGPQPAVR